MGSICCTRWRDDEEDVHFVTRAHEPEAASPAAGRGGAPRFTKLEPGFRLNCENAADACLRDGDDPPPPAIAPIVGDSSWWRSGDESSVQKVDGEKVVETPLIAGLGPPPTTDGRAAEPPATLGCPSAAAVAASPLWPFSPWSRPVAAAATGRNGASAGGGGGGGDGASAERSGGGSSRSRQAGVTRRGDATRGGRRGRAAAEAWCGCARVRCARRTGGPLVGRHRGELIAAARRRLAPRRSAHVREQLQRRRQVRAPRVRAARHEFTRRDVGGRRRRIVGQRRRSRVHLHHVLAKLLGGGGGGVEEGHRIDALGGEVDLREGGAGDEREEEREGGGRA